MKLKNILFVVSILIFSNCFLSIGQETNNVNSKTKEGLNEADFLKAKERDRIKNSYALSHNIKLYRIPYWEVENIKCFSPYLFQGII